MLQFTGISANAGRAEGPVCVVHSADEFGHCKRGDIALLVGVKPTAALAKMVKGFAAVHGGVTSHAAIVARECGIPAVVGLKEDVLAHVKNGDAMKVDADAGVVCVRDSV